MVTSHSKEVVPTTRTPKEPAPRLNSCSFSSSKTERRAMSRMGARALPSWTKLASYRCSYCSNSSFNKTLWSRIILYTARLRKRLKGSLGKRIGTVHPPIKQRFKRSKSSGKRMEVTSSMERRSPWPKQSCNKRAQLKAARVKTRPNYWPTRHPCSSTKRRIKTRIMTHLLW